MLYHPQQIVLERQEAMPSYTNVSTCMLALAVRNPCVYVPIQLAGHFP